MSESKDFVAQVDSDARKSPMRVAFVTRRTSAQVKTRDEEHVMTYPAALFSVAVAVETLAVILVCVSLLWDAPLEGLADPMHTPNPAKAPWYFLGLQELLHYFPPVVAGVLIPALVVIALIVIPYFNINTQGEGLWLSDKRRRLWIFWLVSGILLVFLLAFEVYPALLPTIIVMAFMLVASDSTPDSRQKFRRWLAAKPLSFWIMTWFLGELVILTCIGTFFRGPEWSWAWPWRS